MTPHIVDQLASAELYNEPFAHMIIDNFLPADVFQKIVEISTTTNTGYKPVDMCCDHQNIIDTRDSKQYTDFWQQWYTWFEAPQVTQLLAERFASTGALQNMRCDIHQCNPGFALHKHNDKKADNREMISLQIYAVGSGNGVVLHNKYVENKPNRAWLFKSTADSWHHVPRIKDYRTSVLMKYDYIL